MNTYVIVGWAAGEPTYTTLRNSTLEEAYAIAEGEEYEEFRIYEGVLVGGRGHSYERFKNEA